MSDKEILEKMAFIRNKLARLEELKATWTTLPLEQMKSTSSCQREKGVLGSRYEEESQEESTAIENTKEELIADKNALSDHLSRHLSYLEAQLYSLGSQLGSHLE